MQLHLGRRNLCILLLKNRDNFYISFNQLGAGNLDMEARREQQP